MAGVLVGVLCLVGCGRAQGGGPIELAVTGLANAHVTLAADGEYVAAAWAGTGADGTDIYAAVSADGGRTFQDPVRVSEDNWKIDACPDDGPAMTVDGQGALRVAWPTLLSDPDGPRMAIFESTSRDGGVTFSPRARVDAARGSAAHPRIAAGAGTQAAIVWDELSQGARPVMFRRSGGGAASTLSPGRIASYPAVAAAGEGFVVAWTDQDGERSVIRTMRVR